MTKFIKIEVIDNKGAETVKFTSEGLSRHEVIGLLTVYRDDQIVDYLRNVQKTEEKK